jgi:hypothetical protein
MRNIKTGWMAIALIILLPTAGVTGSYLALSTLAGDGPEQQIEYTTRFYVTNETEIISLKPVVYRIILENQEGTAVNYGIKVQLAGKEINDQQILLDNGNTSNKTISLTSPLTGEYQKLEFILYKNGEPYRTRVFQILPSIDPTSVPAIKPPLLKNGSMENSSDWKFTGKDFRGSYTTSDQSSGRRSYMIQASKGVKAGAFGSIEQEFSSSEAGMASLSFDVRSDNGSYLLSSIVNDNIVWKKTTGNNWTRIKAPVFLKRSNRIVLNVSARNETSSGVSVWWDNIMFENYTSAVTETPVKKEIIPEVYSAPVRNYTVQKNGNNSVYLYEAGERLEFLVTDGNVSAGDMVYTTKVNGRHIVFLNELHEILLPDNLHHLLAVTEERYNVNLKVNENVKLKNGYAVKLTDIKNMSLMINISLNNNTVSTLKSAENSSLEYWKYKSLDSYKKDKILEIIPTAINEKNATFNILQFGGKKLLMNGDNYEELKIMNITEDSITMKNSRPIRIETGKVLSLVKGKIKIKV